jgi:hypothetical protein
MIYKKQLRNKTLLIATVSALAVLASTQATLAQDNNISFVACPIIQDTNTVPCWLAEHEGKLYFLGIQTDAGGWSPPWLGHKLLVEGTVTTNPRVCGGIVLESNATPYERRGSGSSAGVELPNPPVTSVMRELDANCRTMLPEQDRYNTIEARRGPGPSPAPPPRTPEAVAAAAAERAEREAAEREEAASIVPPYQPREYEMLYEFDSELAVFTIGQVEDALEYAAKIGASRLSVTGYRSSSLLSSGEQLEEAVFIAKRRAQELESTMRMLGVPEGTSLEINWEEAVVPGNGRDDWSRRRALVRVTP